MSITSKDLKNGGGGGGGGAFDATHPPPPPSPGNAKKAHSDSFPFSLPINLFCVANVRRILHTDKLAGAERVIVVST